MRQHPLSALLMWLITLAWSSSVYSAVGRTPGTFDVSATGAATYDIPLSIPHGAGNMQPKLALAYNSQRGNGLLGMGWSISGLSAISRCQQTYAQDNGMSGGIALTYGDKFCLDGKRLRLTSGGYGQPSSTYQTEIVDFSRITAFGTTGNGPAYFIVEGKDGLTYEYGNTADSQILLPGTSTARTWALSKLSDRQGNYISYTYSTSNGSYRPAGIYYAQNDGQSPSIRYQVSFGYQTRPSSDYITGYLNGVNVSEVNRLNSISVASIKQGESIRTSLRAYNLTYDTASNPTNRSRLKSIQECVQSDCLAATKINWETAVSGWQGVGASLQVSTRGDKVIVLDLNGDGRQDTLFTESSSNYSKACFSLTSSGGGFGSKTCTNNALFYPPDTGRWGTIPPTHFKRVMDFDGDGRQEYLQYNDSADTWQLLMLDASAQLQVISLGFSDAGTSEGGSAFAADVNGDGRDDIAYGRGYTEAGDQTGLYVRTSNGTGFNARQWIYMGLQAGTSKYDTFSNGGIDIGDVNGDRIHDILALGSLRSSGYTGDLPLKWTLYQSNYGSVTSSGGTITGNFYTKVGNYTDSDTPPIVADFNGDGLSDVAFEQTSGSWEVRLATGGSTAPLSAAFSTGITPEQSSLMLAADSNGDGKSDLVFFQSDAWYVARSNGDGTFATAVSLQMYDDTPTAVADMNGDGQLDWLNFVTGTGFELRLHSGSVGDLVRTIQIDGYNIFYTSYYASIAQADIYTRGSSASYPEAEYQTPIYVASKVLASDGTGASYYRYYSYSGARRDLQGRGFLGFQSRAIKDGRNDWIRTISYRTSFPLTGMTYEDKLQQADGTTRVTRSVWDTDWVYLGSATAGNERYFPYVPYTVTASYEVGGDKNGNLITQNWTWFNYDVNYGNITSSKTTLTDYDSESLTYGQNWIQTTTDSISPDTQNWCIGLPTQRTVEQSAPGAQPITRTTSFTPDYVHCRITQQIIEPSSPTYRVTIDYGHDAFGNVNSETVTGLNMPPRTTTINWGTAGQLPEVVTDAKGFSSYAEYDYGSGVQTSAMDPNGIITTWGYDSFGRRTRETRPDGTYATYSYNECAAVSGGCQRADPASTVTNINKMAIIATYRDRSGNALRDDWTYLDPLDRPIVTLSKMLPFENGASYTRVGTQYDTYGNIYRQTAPCDASNCTVYWTTNTYDLLNRLTSQQRSTSAGNSTSTMSYRGLTTTVTDPLGKKSTRMVDPNGQLQRLQNHDGYWLDFGYDAMGSLTSVDDSQSSALFRATYDYGIGALQRQVNDVDLGYVNLSNLNQGAWTYSYNALGELVSYTDAKHQTFTFGYDKLGRVVQRTAPDFYAEWTWGSSASYHGIGKVEGSCFGYSVQEGCVRTQGYGYDSTGRLSEMWVETAPGAEYPSEDTVHWFGWTYNSNTGLLETLTYPTSSAGYRLKLGYSYTNGVLSAIYDYRHSSTVFWQANAGDARGQIVRETFGNNIVSSRSYDAATGWLSATQSGVGGGAGKQNESYLYDQVGNVIQRQNNQLGLTESFYYDNLHRLDYSQLNGVTNLDMAYDALGRITARSDVASSAAWTYHGSKKHAVTRAGDSAHTYSYDDNGNVLARNGGSIAWTSDNYPKTINGSNGETVTLAYGHDRRLMGQLLSNNGQWTESTLYLGDGLMEKVTTYPNNIAQEDNWHYIYAQGRLVAMALRYSSASASEEDYRVYMLTDHQGSIAAITEEGSGTSAGNVLAKESFTAFGNRRNPSTWSGLPSASDLASINTVTRHGYTGHLALGSMGLNHMGGRVQDAITGVFLSADPNITQPDNTQNYNRYTYVYNNPLSHVDPSGFSTDDLDLCSGSSCPSYVGGGADTYYDSETGNSYSVTVTGQFPTQGNYLTGTPSAIDFAAINSNINGGLNALADRSSANGISTGGGTVSPYTPLFRDNFAGRTLGGFDDALGILVSWAIRDGELRGAFSGEELTGRRLMDAKMAIVFSLAGPVNAEANAAKGANFFRGARAGETPSFTPRPNEFKVDPNTGFVKDTHGVSVFDNPTSVSSKGLAPYQVDQSTIPDSLRIIQRGQDPHHFEIVPKPGTNLTRQQFIGACNSILCVR